jgi:peptide/nickel transport system substrate-binding protein
MNKRIINFILSIIIMSVGLTGCNNINNKIKENKTKKFRGNVKEEVTSYERIIKAKDPDSIPNEAKKRKDTLVVGINSPTGKFNPIYSNSIYDNWVCDLVFDGLIKNDEQGKPVGNLAEEWSISEDGKVYYFKLRDNLKFSDGTELTADDVAFTFTALCDPSYTGIYTSSFVNLKGYKEYINGEASQVSGIRVQDKNSISFIFDETRAPLIYDFSIGILSKKYYEFRKDGIEALNERLLKPIGSGPYVFVDFKPGEEIILERNESYWDVTPQIPYILMKITENNSNIKDLINGDIDINRVAAVPNNVKLLEDSGFLDLHIYDNNGFQYIGLNLRKNKFKDKKVRQALLYALDRETFINSYYGSYGSAFNAPFFKASWAYPIDLNEYEYNVEKAAKLLEEAGWLLKEDGWRYNKEGKRFTINWYTYDNNKYVEVLVPQLKKNWKAVGIEVVEEFMTFNELVENVYEKRDFDMYNMSWSLCEDPDPSPIFSYSEDTTGGYNAVGWRNEESEELIFEGLKEMNADKRKTIYEKWGKLANEELPYLYINQNKELYAVNSRVKNLKLSPYLDWTANICRLKLE